jgi:hypothetical protein
MHVHLPYVSSRQYDSIRAAGVHHSENLVLEARIFFRTEIDEEARMKSVLAHISAEVPEQGDDSTTRVAGEEEQKNDLLVFRYLRYNNR